MAPLRSRIVQRAILDVCQSEQPRIQRRCGNLRAALFTPTSVGGLPDRGVAHAIELIRSAIDAGARYYIRSDLKSFFANIPKAELFKFLDRQIQDEAFVNLFKAALETEFSNADDEEIQRWWGLFPSSEKGVPQGSALSAISANIVLADFDRALNAGHVRTIRYLDDFLILAPSKRDADGAWANALSILSALGLEAHLPGDSDKAAVGLIESGFEFLSFRIQGRTLAPSRNAKAKLLEEIEQELQVSRRQIRDAAGDPRHREPRFVQALANIDSKIRGWGDAFRGTTQRLEFTQLDEEISRRLDKFVRWFLHTQKGRSISASRRLWGVALLADTPRFTA